MGRWGITILILVIGMNWACGRVGYDEFAQTVVDASPESIDASQDASGQGWWDTAFQSRLRLRFDSTNIFESLDNVVLPVRITPALFSYLDADPLGADLRFVDSDGVTELAYEIDTWMPGAESLVWVRVPRLDGQSTTDHL
jgi:hypothetical protein